MRLNVDLAPPVNLERFHDRLYEGEVILFRQLPAMERLIEFARQLLGEEFPNLDPPMLHQKLTQAEQAVGFKDFQRRFSRHETVKALWSDLFRTIGYDPELTMRDRLFLRFQPPKSDNDAQQTARATATLPFHRDTWGSNLYAQINWWAPVYPISAARTMAIYPELWERPVSDSSRNFDLAAVLKRARTAGIAAKEAHPQLLEDISGLKAVPVVIEPGDVIAFSGAHAHAGVMNVTGQTRISMETRSIWLPDYYNGRAAPNVDGAAPWAAPGWFRRLSDGEPMHHILGCEELIAYERHGAR